MLLFYLGSNYGKFIEPNITGSNNFLSVLPTNTHSEKLYIYFPFFKTSFTFTVHTPFAIDNKNVPTLKDPLQKKLFDSLKKEAPKPAALKTHPRVKVSTCNHSSEKSPYTHYRTYHCSPDNEKKNPCHSLPARILPQNHHLSLPRNPNHTRRFFLPSAIITHNYRQTDTRVAVISLTLAHPFFGSLSLPKVVRSHRALRRAMSGCKDSERPERKQKTPWRLPIMSRTRIRYKADQLGAFPRARGVPFSCSARV